MEQIINAERIEQVISVFGSFDENIKKIEQAFSVRVVNRGTELKISGEDEQALLAARASAADDLDIKTQPNVMPVNGEILNPFSNG